MGRTSQWADRMIVSIERQQAGPPVRDRLDVHGTGPEAVEMTQGVLRMVDAQVDSEVLVQQVQLAAIAVIAVLDPDDRLAEVGQVEEEPLLDLLELAALDLIRVVLVVVLVTEELVALAEVLSQERADECHVIVDLADLEDLLAAQPELFVPLPA